MPQPIEVFVSLFGLEDARAECHAVISNGSFVVLDLLDRSTV
jgi:hypothetical protein